MFNSKQKKLFEVVKTETSANDFIQAGLQKSAETVSGNGALKYSTTGNSFVDQFGVIGSYKEPRSFEDISRDMSILWAESPKDAVAFALYLRMVTRQVMLFNGKKTETTQRGAGVRHEAIMRFVWLAVNQEESFWNNLHLLISAGSWKDIIQMLSYDLQYHGWNGRVLDWEKISNVLLAGLSNQSHSDLIKKYLPQIKSNSKCKTVEAQADNMIAKFIASRLFSNVEKQQRYKQYRKLKTSGQAHEWQQLISQQKFSEIDFGSVHGRALSLLVSGDFLTKNGLEEKYEQWISQMPVAKYTGYPHELFKGITKGLKKYQVNTINKQFDGLVQTAKKNAKTNTSMIVVRDTSGSMCSTAHGTTQSCYDIAKALALFFSEMLPDGYFANNWIEFNNTAKMHTWKGSTPIEKWQNDRSGVIGSTNFQSVIDLFVQIKKSGISEEQFPTGIICISDSEFNPTSDLKSSNVQSALKKLDTVFSKEYVENFKIVLWNLQSRYYGDNTGKKFETFGDVKNVFYFSGYDGSVVSFLTGTTDKEKSEPKTAQELLVAALDQELLNMVIV